MKKGEPTPDSASHVIRKRAVAGRGQRTWGGGAQGTSSTQDGPPRAAGLAAGWSLHFITARTPGDRRPLPPGCLGRESGCAGEAAAHRQGAGMESVCQRPAGRCGLRSCPSRQLFLPGRQRL